MKRFCLVSVLGCVVVLLAASAASAQRYGGGGWYGGGWGGSSYPYHSGYSYHYHYPTYYYPRAYYHSGYGEVWFDGQKTRQTGTTRHFVTRSLESGRTYSYQISAAWHENGRLVTQERTVQVRAGRACHGRLRHSRRHQRAAAQLTRQRTLQRNS